MRNLKLFKLQSSSSGQHLSSSSVLSHTHTHENIHTHTYANIYTRIHSYVGIYFSTLFLLHVANPPLIHPPLIALQFLLIRRRWNFLDLIRPSLLRHSPRTSSSPQTYRDAGARYYTHQALSKTSPHQMGDCEEGRRRRGKNSSTVRNNNCARTSFRPVRGNSATHKPSTKSPVV